MINILFMAENSPPTVHLLPAGWAPAFTYSHRVNSCVALDVNLTIPLSLSLCAIPTLLSGDLKASDRRRYWRRVAWALFTMTCALLPTYSCIQTGVAWEAFLYSILGNILLPCVKNGSGCVVWAMVVEKKEGGREKERGEEGGGRRKMDPRSSLSKGEEGRRAGKIVIKRRKPLSIYMINNGGAQRRARGVTASPVVNISARARARQQKQRARACCSRASGSAASFPEGKEGKEKAYNVCYLYLAAVGRTSL